MDFLRLRLRNQKLHRSELREPAGVVRWLGAVQAQDYLGAKWAVGLRTKSITDGDVERAFDEGAILRTHVLRPTCHFVAPEDIRWMLALTAPRIRAANAYTYRKYELDRDVFRRSRKTLERALRGGKERTRSELASALRREGVAAEGIRLAALMIEAELEGVVVSGPRRGRRFTYALLEERAPQGAALPREEALAELTRRYFSSHGPATLSDYAWWSGLTMGDAKRGIEVVEPALAREDLDGRAYWFVQSKAPAERASTSAHLLPNYDEYLIAYKDRGPVTGASARDVFSHSLVIDGRLAGNWRRTLRKDSVLADALLYRRLSRGDASALAAAAKRYGRFMGMRVEIRPACAGRRVEPRSRR